MAKKVLVVDDSKSIVAMIQYSLEKVGHQVLTAYDGNEGLQRLEEAGGVDLILCDLNMPNMDGLSMLKAIKASKKYAKIPFLMLTTEAQQSLRQQAKDAGAKAWIIKPFTDEQIQGAIKKFIK